MQPRGNGSWSWNRAADWCQAEISVAFPGTSVKLWTGFTREICPFRSSLGSYEAEKYAKRRKMSCKVGEDILEKYKTLEWIILQKTVPFICVFDVCLLCRNRHPLPCHSGASGLRGERFVSVMGNIWLSFTLSLYFVSWGGEVRTSPGKDNEGEFTLWNYNFSSATTFLVLVLSFSTFCCSNDCSFWIFCLSCNYKAPVFEAAFLTKPSIFCSLLSSLSRDRN